MTIERRPDGALRFTMHVPLWTSLVVMAAFFGFATVFAYGLFFEDTGSLQYRGVDFGFVPPPIAWKVLFFLATLGMAVPGIFILLSLLRGGKPHVRLDQRKVTVAGRPMANDVSVRWDEIASIARFRIQHGAAIGLKTKAGKKLQLSEHVFPEKGEFALLCHEIETRAARFGGFVRD